MRHCTRALAAICVAVVFEVSWAATSAAQQNPVTAIDILLQPDATMLKHAQAANERLLKVFPKSFSLDAAHTPHLTTLQRYVRTADLDKVYEAVGKVLDGEKIASWKLKAFKYYYIPSGEIGLAGIVVEPTDDWLRLQQKIIDAVTPFTVTDGTAEAYYIPPAEGPIVKGLLEYVQTFVPDATGKKFNPHVTIGIASQEYLKTMLAEPFEAFTFSPESAAVYHLGNYGTARVKLHSWELKP
jgi:hypothetical protein